MRTPSYYIKNTLVVHTMYKGKNCKRPKDFRKAVHNQVQEIYIKM